VLERDDWRAAMRFVVRRLLLPATPQWYIPLAAQVRQLLGLNVHTKQFHQESLPSLPFTVDPVLRTTRELADFFGRLDRLGILVPCLAANPSINRLPVLMAYRQWREDLIADLDEGLGQTPALDGVITA